MSACAQDADFGPISTCRAFDFTLAFEASILSLLPSAVFLLLAAVLLCYLRKAPRLITPFRYLPKHGKLLVICKLAVVAAAGVCDAIALAAWVVDQNGTFGSGIVVASLATRLAASLISLPLVYLEFFRRLQASPALPLFLTFTALCDAARVRTFAFVALDGSKLFFGAFAAAYGLRLGLWFLETVPKSEFVERAEGDKPMATEETSSFFARVLITSIDPVLWRGFRTTLSIQSLGVIPSRYDAERLYDIGHPHWERHLASGKKNPLIRSMISCFGGTLVAPILPCVIYSLAQATQPTLIADVIAFIESYQTGDPADHQPVAFGWGLVAAYGLVFLISTLSWALFQMSALRSSVAVRGFLVQLIYRKSLRVHTSVSKQIGTGQSTSLMSVDVERIVQQMEALHLLYSSFIIVLIGMVILYYTIGLVFIATIVAAVAFILSIPLLSRSIPARQKAWSARTDLRVRLVNSVIRNIKAVKLSGYEGILIAKLEKLRELETATQAAYLRMLLIVSGLTNWLKGLLTLATLITYTIVSLHSSTHIVSTGVFFTTIAVLGVVTDPLLIVGQRYAAIMAARASIARIEEFLQRPEKKDDRGEADEIRAEKLALGTPDIELLRDMDFVFPLDKLTMVLGQGKSTLLHGLMGEVDILRGTLHFPKTSSIGFCSQDAWLRTGDTVRQNIQFTNSFHPALYRAVVRACALETDFKIWPQGDKQKAQGLSGGQKQRLALARALYARPDILILDDIFSALDKQTEEHVFRWLFGPQGLLVDKTVILATNAVHRLARADHIVVIDNNTILQQGTFTELSSSAGAVQELLEIAGASKEAEEDPSTAFTGPAMDAASSYIASLAANVDDIEAEMAAETSKRSPALVYFSAGGPYSFALAMLLISVFSVVPGLIPVYIQAWTTAVQRNQSQMLAYLGGYIAVEMAYAITFVLALGYYFLVYIKASSRTLHSREIRGLLGTAQSYFDDKPLGRILSRFSQDLFVIDFEMPNAFMNFAGLVVEMLTIAVIITIAAPYVGIVLLFTLILGILIQRFYIVDIQSHAKSVSPAEYLLRTSRQVRRMDFIAKSPLYTLFAETMDADGLKTIRAVQAEPELLRTAVTKGNTSQVPYYIMQAVKKWLNLVMGLTVTVINVVLVLVAVLNRSSTNAGVLAVALVQATTLVFTLNLTIVSGAEFETCLVAVSRVQETTELPAEENEAHKALILPPSEDDGPGDKIENDQDIKLQKAKNPHDWITSGSVRFQNVVLKYREDLPPALKDLSFKIVGGRKVGIVGRSGCGKSTVLSALFRMMEVESGGIYIDGVDIRSMPRSMLRNAMTIIPQDPLMLELSIRENLDLEGLCSDQQIWAALEQTQCKVLIENLPDKLETIVTGDGGDFSRGERQLLALARALLRNRRLLVLDEASSSLDIATDAVVQQVLRDAFRTCTVAHRLNTLLDYDEIIVLSAGELLEQGSPQDLMKRSEGAFSRLLRGEQTAEAQRIEEENDETEAVRELL